MRRSTSSVAGLRVLQLGPLYVDHVRRWSQHAAALGCRVHVAGHVRPERRRVDFSAVAESVHLGPANGDQADGSRHQAWLHDLLNALQPDLVQAHWLRTWGWFAARSGHPRVAVTAWGCDMYRAGGHRHRAHEALRGADRVLVGSAHMEREVVAHGARQDRTLRVDLGVDLERFRPGSQAQARAQLGLPDGPVVLSFRAGEALYNLDVVLAAFRILRAELPDATLVLVPGDAPLAPSVRAGLRDTAGVRVVGHVDHADMPRYLRAATVGISIPRSDGSPNSVWEALACGLPVVLSDLPQISERLGGSAAARFVAPRPPEVSRALHEIVVDPSRRAEMARAGRAWALANVDERGEIERLERVYAAMAPAQAARPRAPDTATAAAAPHRPS